MYFPPPAEKVRPRRDTIKPPPQQKETFDMVNY
jgi:hypothetical protein